MAILLPGSCQAVTGILLFVGSTWFQVLTDPALHMAALAFSAVDLFLRTGVAAAERWTAPAGSTSRPGDPPSTDHHHRRTSGSRTGPMTTTRE